MLLAAGKKAKLQTRIGNPTKISASRNTRMGYKTSWGRKRSLHTLPPLKHRTRSMNNKYICHLLISYAALCRALGLNKYRKIDKEEAANSSSRSLQGILSSIDCGDYFYLWMIMIMSKRYFKIGFRLFDLLQLFAKSVDNPYGARILLFIWGQYQSIYAEA